MKAAQKVVTVGAAVLSVILLGAITLTFPHISRSAATAGNTNPEFPRKAEQRAEQILREAGDYLRGLDSFRGELTVIHELSIKEERRRNEVRRRDAVKYEFAMRRPNKFALDFRAATHPSRLSVEMGPFGAGRVVFDGRTLYTYVPRTGRYMTEGAPAVLRAGRLSGRPMDFLHDLRIARFLFGDEPYHAFTHASLSRATYAGTERLDGVELHRIHVRETFRRWTLWIETGERPLLRKAVLAGRRTPERKHLVSQHELPADGRTFRIETVEWAFIFGGWEPNADLPDERFTFEPPEGAEPVDSLDQFFPQAHRALIAPALPRDREAP